MDLLQQARIESSLRTYQGNGSGTGIEYPLDLERELIGCVYVYDEQRALTIFRKLFTKIREYEKDTLSRVKVRAAEVCTLLCRACIERGTDNDLQLYLNSRLLEALKESRSMEDVEILICRNLDIYTSTLQYVDSQHSRNVRRVLRHVLRHFPENITLMKISADLNISPGHLSTQIRQETGMTFREYLNRVRVEEARRLIDNTDYTLIEIAIACGFRDQSYFTKIFKRYTGKTPGQYR